jgi:hypothetical protein
LFNSETKATSIITISTPSKPVFAATFAFVTSQMEKFRKKSKVMLAIEITIYLAIAVSVALLIIL